MAVQLAAHRVDKVAKRGGNLGRPVIAMIRTVTVVATMTISVVTVVVHVATEGEAVGAGATGWSGARSLQGRPMEADAVPTTRASGRRRPHPQGGVEEWEPGVEDWELGAVDWESGVEEWEPGAVDWESGVEEWDSGAVDWESGVEEWEPGAVDWEPGVEEWEPRGEVGGTLRSIVGAVSQALPWPRQYLVRAPGTRSHRGAVSLARAVATSLRGHFLLRLFLLLREYFLLFIFLLRQGCFRLLFLLRVA